MAELEVQFSKGHLSVIGQELEGVPEDLVRQYAAATDVDFSCNMLTDISAVAGFPKMKNLVLDSNALTHESTFPSVPGLTTLWVNDNHIAELQPFLDALKASYPNLTYLSMLKNPACPNFFTGKQQEEYKRYRLFVLHNLPDLKFLDASPVTAEEKAQAASTGRLMAVVKPNEEQLVESQRKLVEKQQKEMAGIRDLPADVREVGGTRASLGVSRYVYKGKQSEGNRFITNDQL
mmetsp:Transcript_18486/g.71374  ORF Transcript_18486/g.71374 Transcript_18486/m.71374 type:complete len:234 (-) Transcript_18486:98-799(-)